MTDTPDHVKQRTFDIWLNDLERGRGSSITALEGHEPLEFEQVLKMWRGEYRVDDHSGFEELSTHIGSYPDPRVLHRIARFLREHGEPGLAYLMRRSEEEGCLFDPSSDPDTLPGDWIYQIMPGQRYTEEAGADFVEQQLEEYHSMFVGVANAKHFYIDYARIWFDWSINQYDAIALEDATYIFEKKRA